MGRIFSDFSSWLHSGEEMNLIEQTLDDALKCLEAEKRGEANLNFRLRAIEIGLRAIKGGEVYCGRDDGVYVPNNEMGRLVLLLALEAVPEGGAEVGDRLAALALENLRRARATLDTEDSWIRSSPVQLLNMATRKARLSSPIRRELAEERRRMGNRGLGAHQRLVNLFRSSVGPAF